MTELYYTPDKPQAPVWILEINKESQEYAITVRKNPSSAHRFLAMPTFLTVLSQCAGYKHVNYDVEA